MANPREAALSGYLPQNQEMSPRVEVPRNSSLVLQMPGQGGQAVKLGYDILYLPGTNPPQIRSQAAGQIWTMAGDYFGGDFIDKWENGPVDDTGVTQEIITTVSLMRMATLEELQLGDPSWYTPDGKLNEKWRVGLSVGLVAAGVGVWYDAEEAIKFQKVRAEATSEFFEGIDAKMFAVDEIPEDLQDEMRQDNDVLPLLYNTPKQTVWGGPSAAVDDAVRWLREKKTTDSRIMRKESRATVLRVKGLFHHPVLKPVAEALVPHVTAMRFYETPTGKILLSNVTGMPLETAEEVRTDLIQHLYKPVRHKQSMAHVLTQGATAAITMDAGKRLTDMNKVMFEGDGEETVVMPEITPGEEPPVIVRVWRAAA